MIFLFSSVFGYFLRYLRDIRGRVVVGGASAREQRCRRDVRRRLLGGSGRRRRSRPSRRSTRYFEPTKSVYKAFVTRCPSPLMQIMCIFKPSNSYPIRPTPTFSRTRRRRTSRSSARPGSGRRWRRGSRHCRTQTGRCRASRTKSSMAHQMYIVQGWAK